MILYIFAAIQYGICLISIICVIWYKFSYNRSEKHRQNVEQRLKQLFTRLLTEQIRYEQVDWKNEPLEMEPLLDLLESFNDKFQDEHWEAICYRLSFERLLPWARQHAQSHRWITKNRVIRIFLLTPLPEDLKSMTRFLHDHAYSIRMLAAEAIGKLRIPDVIPLLISQMAREVSSARFIYRTVLLRAPKEHFPVLLQIFDQTESDRVKICCLDIMSHRFYGNVHPLLKKHLNSKNPTIRSMIARILQLIRSNEARDDLMHLLDDPVEKVRICAVEALGKLQDRKAFEKVSQMLHDAKYEVRLAAAFALFNYGKEGIHVLQLQDADLNPQAHEVARYVLTLP